MTVYAHIVQLKMLSPDGLGRMWDKDANGYARGEYVLSIFLHPQRGSPSALITEAENATSSLPSRRDSVIADDNC